MLSEEYTKAMEFFSTDKLKCIESMEKIIYDNKNKPSESLDPYLRLSELYRETNIEKSIELIEYVTSKTNDASVLNNLAVLYTEGLRIDDAKRIYLRIINECKDHKTLHVSLCNFNQMMDLYIYEFIAYIHLTLKLHPTLTDELSAIIHQALIMDYNDIYTKDINSIINILEDNENKNKRDRITIDFKSLSPSNDIDIIYNEHLKINKYFKTKQQYDFKNRQKNSKIRIGYVSSDFRNHAVSKFMKNIILNHNKNLFDIYTYYTYSIYDKYTDIFKNNTNFKDISKLNVKQSCDIIYNDNIDILIDLNGHTGLNRLEIFAYKPAPIQITYLGYPNTTGLDEMDYRITDKIADPLDSKQKYSEQLLHLDTCFLNYSFPDYKYTNSYNNNDDVIIYSITNRIRKQCPMFLETVKTILKNKQNSKIKILIHSLSYKKHYVESFYKKTLDIDDNRIEIITNLKEEFYFDYFNSVDVILDTFPYSAATIACDALYMSTPIITLSQPDSHVHNVSKTVLYNVAPELITYSINQYINTAINMDKKLIKKYKSELHSKFCSSMDINNFIKTYENTLLKTLKYSSTNFFNSHDIITWEKLHSISDHFIDINNSSNKFYDINTHITESFNNNYIVFISSSALLNPNLYIHLDNFKNKFKVILYDNNYILTSSIFSQLKNIKNIQHIYTNYLPCNDILLTPIPSYTNDKLKVLERINIKSKIDLIFSESNCNIKDTNYDQYLNILKLYKYAIYKECKDDSLWDYLNLNIIPICLKSPLSEYYSKHLPMILVNDFNEIDMVDLQTNYHKYKNAYKNKDVCIFKNLYSTIIV